MHSGPLRPDDARGLHGAGLPIRPGIRRRDRGGEPGKVYNTYLAAPTKGDMAALRALVDEEGGWRYSEDDPTAAGEALKSARDGQPVQAEILRGRVTGRDAVLWVQGVWIATTSGAQAGC